MKKLVAFDLDGTLAESKQAMSAEIAEAFSELTSILHVAVISGGDWPQFNAQLVGQLDDRIDRTQLSLMPTSGTKLYAFQDGGWVSVYADSFSDEERRTIITALTHTVEKSGFKPAEIWGEQIEDRGSQITFSALGQQAPLEAKEQWDPDFTKRKAIQAELQKLLPELSVNLGGTTSIDITEKGIDKAYGLERLRERTAIEFDDMIFIGDAIFPGGNDYPAKELGLDTICVRDPIETLAVMNAIIACQK